MKQEDKIIEGSENVFADLGLPDADERLAKAKLAHEICVLIRRQGLSQTRAARLLGVDQPKVSALMHGRLDGFSSDRLFRFLTALGQDIDVRVHPARESGAGRIHVMSA